MYRDNSLIPSEAARLAALGLLAERPRPYADLASDVRSFTSRLVGPSLDMVGTPLELLRYEGLISTDNDRESQDSAVLRVTDAGLAALKDLLRSTVRAPVDHVGRLVIALKLRFLDQLDAGEQGEQIDLLIDLTETELARLQDLKVSHDGEPGLLTPWLAHETGYAEDRLAWLRETRARV